MRKKKAPAAGGLVVSRPSASRRIESTLDGEKAPNIYANNAFVEISNWDVRIRLGLVQSVTPELVTVRDVANLYMSHQHAKAFVTALQSTLENLEKAQKLNADVPTKIQ